MTASQLDVAPAALSEKGWSHRRKDSHFDCRQTSDDSRTRNDHDVKDFDPSDPLWLSYGHGKPLDT